jgi:uncharacterized membrane protein YcaP (DUF421 family)
MQGIFELVTIITLGSAAGDPMFYKKVGLLPGILVFLTIFIMYKIINFFVARNMSFEHLIEGKEVRLVKDKRFAIENFRKDELAKDEIFMDLRQKGVSHLGQVDAAYVEPSGELSVFFLPDEEVGYGLPVRPELYENKHTRISEAGVYSCKYCGFTEEKQPGPKHTCVVCDHVEWVRSVNEKRVK